jgi:DNA-binding transcriptional MerR regulator
VLSGPFPQGRFANRPDRDQGDRSLAEEIPDKLYFKIGEVARITGVKPHVLRYWESEFKVVRPIKSKSNQRLYRKKDVESILMIKNMLYNERYTIAGAKRRLKQTAGEGRGRQLDLGLGRQETASFLGEVADELEGILELVEDDAIDGEGEDEDGEDDTR